MSALGLKVYVATAYANRAEARALMDTLEGFGHTITHDWTSEALDPSWSAEKQATYLQECGRADFYGVEEADAVVLVNHKDARDAMAEFGIALGGRLPVFVLYPERRTSVFFHRATLCASVDEILAALVVA